MLVSAFDYPLPAALIAQRPPAVRGTSRLLRLDRGTGAWQDRRFAELPELLRAGDLLVLNDTRVLPARLFATRAGLRRQAGSPAPAGSVEVLLTEPVGGGENVWHALVKPAKKVPVGETLLFAAAPDEEPVLRAEVIGAGEFGERTLRFGAVEDFHAVLERIGHLPLPPYIRRDKAGRDTGEDRERYQTVYSVPFWSRVQGSGFRAQGSGFRAQGSGFRAQGSGFRAQDQDQDQTLAAAATRGGQSGPAGSAAAPTAGLHFTPELLAAAEGRGVEVARVTLHVGLGTFQPVRVERTEDIRLHAEPYTLGPEAAEAVNRAWGEGRRIVAVGTTTTRMLEHTARSFEARYGALGTANPLRLEPHLGSTGLFLSPGPEGDDRFKVVSGLVTNFHLPQSTLLMLVSAFAGRERVLAAYGHAVEAGYRFFSYGDCMLVL